MTRAELGKLESAIALFLGEPVKVVVTPGALAKMHRAEARSVASGKALAFAVAGTRDGARASLLASVRGAAESHHARGGITRSPRAARAARPVETQSADPALLVPPAGGLAPFLLDPSRLPKAPPGRRTVRA